MNKEAGPVSKKLESVEEAKKFLGKDTVGVIGNENMISCIIKRGGGVHSLKKENYVYIYIFEYTARNKYFGTTKSDRPPIVNIMETPAISKIYYKKK